MRQGTVCHMAIPLELLVWSISSLEDSHDSRHLPLETADHHRHCRRVSRLSLIFHLPALIIEVSLERRFGLQQ